MLVMNDRSQAGSSYKDGRIEFLINRFGVTNDELGMRESMMDKTIDGRGPNVTAQFWLTLQSNKDRTYERLFRRHS